MAACVASPSSAIYFKNQLRDPEVSSDWTFWIHQDDSRARGRELQQWLAQLKQSDTFNTWNKLLKSWEKTVLPNIPFISACMMFRSGIPPVWEHPSNQNGGKFAFSLSTGLPAALDSYQTLLNDFIFDNPELAEDINGVVFSFRSWGGTITIWNTDWKSEAKVERMRSALQKRFCNGDPEYRVLYQPHHVSMSLNSNHRRRHTPQNQSAKNQSPKKQTPTPAKPVTSPRRSSPVKAVSPVKTASPNKTTKSDEVVVKPPSPRKHSGGNKQPVIYRPKARQIVFPEDKSSSVPQPIAVPSQPEPVVARTSTPTEEPLIESPEQEEPIVITPLPAPVATVPTPPPEVVFEEPKAIVEENRGIEAEDEEEDAIETKNTIELSLETWRPSSSLLVFWFILSFLLSGVFGFLN